MTLTVGKVLFHVTFSVLEFVVEIVIGRFDRRAIGVGLLALIIHYSVMVFRLTA